MSDLWPFTSSSAPPIIHHSSLSSPFISSPPPLSSPVSPGNHGNPPHAKVSSSYRLIPQTSSPLLSELHVTSPHQLPPPQVTSHPVSHPQVTSPHLLYQPQEPPPHCVPWFQVTSPPHSQPQISSSHLLPQAHLPHPYITSPHHVPQPQITSPHLLSPPQCYASNQTQDAGLDHPDWSRAAPPPELSALQRSYSYSCQNQATVQLDLHNHNQFSTGMIHHVDELQSTHRLPYTNMYQQGDTAGPVQDPWRPPLSQLQCSPLGSMSGEVALGGWSSSPAEDSCSAQFFHNNAPQPFCSPNTPGPSPHYPQTPTVSSPAPQMYPCLHEYDSYLMICDPGQLHPHQTSQHLLQSQEELIQDQAGLLDAAGNSESCFCPQGGGQEVSSTAQPPEPPAGPSWREGDGGGGGGAGQPDWTWVKNPRHKPSTELLNCRFLCTVCKRDFRSLPALNGHMRSHSGSRSAAWMNKGGDDPSPLASPSVSTVMPVTVPVQPRGSAKGCAVLYRSLLRLETAVHYTPPPMLCPLRAGPGLYCSLATRRRQRAQTVQLHTHDDLVAMETASPPAGTPETGISKPQINVGRDFQAEPPPLQGRKHTHPDSHNALLLWTPCDELERPVNQQRVEALLTMARSSVVPGGGASTESALHVLSECRGDFLLTVETLLSTPESSDNDEHAAQQRVSWSPAERKMMLKSLQLHHKDFSRVQKDVQTKSVSQCVEFYYLWKKKLSLSARTPAGLTITLPDSNGQRSSKIT